MKNDTTGIDFGMRATETLATLFTLLGFYLISDSVFLVGFSLALVGNILWGLWATGSGARGILIVNAIMAFSSLNGIIGNF